MGYADERVAAALMLHRPTLHWDSHGHPIANMCDTCGVDWPCPTAYALGIEGD